MSGSSGESVVTIGTYDGVHLGHQRLIAEAKAEGARLGLSVVVVTFDRHPSVTLRPDATTKLITGLELKLELIEAAGVDEVVVLDFDTERAHELPEAFAAELVTDLEARVVIVGENFRFGRDHRGDVSLLERLGHDLGFAARGIGLVTDAVSQVVVSSRMIRERIAAGAIADVNRVLGRPFELRGEWVGSGREGAFVPAGELCCPPAGKYRVAVRISGGEPSAPVDALVEEDRTVLVTGFSDLPVVGGPIGLCFIDPE